MILYTKLDCPLCAVVKTKLGIAGIEYTECQDENKMEELGIDRLPVAQLEFKEILNYVNEVTKQ